MNVVLATSHTDPRHMCLDPHTQPRRGLYMRRAHTSHKWILVLSLQISMSCATHLFHAKIIILVNIMLSSMCNVFQSRQYCF